MSPFRRIEICGFVELRYKSRLVHLCFKVRAARAEVCRPQPSLDPLTCLGALRSAASSSRARLGLRADLYLLRADPPWPISGLRPAPKPFEVEKVGPEPGWGWGWAAVDSLSAQSAAIVMQMLPLPLRRGPHLPRMRRCVQHGSQANCLRRGPYPDSGQWNWRPGAALVGSPFRRQEAAANVSTGEKSLPRNTTGEGREFSRFLPTEPAE